MNSTLKVIVKEATKGRKMGDAANERSVKVRFSAFKRKGISYE